MFASKSPRRRPAAAASVLCCCLAAAGIHAQSYTCPEVPDWSAVPCSMHEAITPYDWDGYHLTLVYTKPGGRRIYVVTAGSSTAKLDIYGHFEDPEWVARRLAKAWAGQPDTLRRSAMPLSIGIDRTGPIYWDYTDRPQQTHIVEFPASYVHEYARTLDWAFEELLTHELCHVIDSRSKLRDKPAWRDAVRMDDRRVSDYAEQSNAEDFAESCAAYVLLGVGRDALTRAHREHVERAIPNRLAYMDSLFSRWGDLISEPPIQR